MGFGRSQFGLWEAQHVRMRTLMHDSMHKERGQLLGFGERRAAAPPLSNAGCPLGLVHLNLREFCFCRKLEEARVGEVGVVSRNVQPYTVASARDGEYTEPTSP